MTKPRTFKEGILSFEDRAERYIKYVRAIEHRRFNTGLYHIDEAIRGVGPGEVLTIIAYSGTFKSALLQNLLIQSAAKTQKYQLMFSMEMPVEKCFEREIQIANNINGRTVEHNYKSMTKDAERYHGAAYAAGGKYLLVVEEGRLNLDRMAKYVHMAETVHGEVGSIGIDYLGLMQGDGKTIFEKMAELSYGVKELAKKLDLPVILLGQVNRGYAASKDNGIEMDAAKGGGDIEAGADFMLGMYTHEGDIIMRILKNRNGRAGQSFRVEINRDSLNFIGVEPWEPPKKVKRGEKGGF